MTEWCDLYQSGEPVCTILEWVLVAHALPEVQKQPLLGPLFVLLPGERLQRIVLPALPDLPSSFQSVSTHPLPLLSGLLVLFLPAHIVRINPEALLPLLI